MLTPDQIAAESILPALTESQLLNLELLVKQYKPYRTASGRWPNFKTKLLEEQNIPTAKTQVLKAVLTAVNNLPELVVESQGQAESPGFFSTKHNWDALALDVLDVMYDLPLTLGPTQFGVVQRQIQKLPIYDDMVLPESKTGDRW